MAEEGQKTLVRMGGSVIAGLVDAGFEGYCAAWNAAHPDEPFGFPFVPTINPLPPADDFIVLGASALPLLLGAITKNELATNIGEGMICYTAPMIVHHTMLRASWGLWGPAARLVATKPVAAQARGYPVAPGLSRRVRYAPEQRIVTAPKFIPGVLRPKFMLGA